MSIGELAMVVNSNFNKPLNEQARELAYSGGYLFTASATFVPDRSGWYKVIVVSSGGDGYITKNRQGSSGGVAIRTISLKNSEIYSIQYTSSDISFEDMTCTHAKNATTSASGSAGTATGGDINYNGLQGSTGAGKVGADVGVFIPELAKTNVVTKEGNTYESGYGICGYGCGQTVYSGEYDCQTPNKGGCVLIIPLELE